MGFKQQYIDLFNEADITSGWKRLNQRIVDDFAITKNQIKQQAAEMLASISKMKVVDSKNISEVNNLKSGLENLKKKTIELTEAEKQHQQIINATTREKAKQSQKNIEAAAALKKEKDVTRALIKEKGIEETSYIGINNQLNKNIAKYKQLSVAQRNAGSSKLLLRNIKQQTLELQRLDAQMGRHQRNVGNYASGFRNLGAAMGVSLGLYGIFRVLKNSTKIVTDFSKAQSTLAATMGKTKDEIQGLSKDALKYGKATEFTANQVAGLQNELAKLGFTQAEIKSSTKAILNLSSATGAELSEAAKVAGSALRAFNLDASESDRVASVLAVATTKSALSFGDYGTALSTVAPVAKAFGFTIEDTVALLGKLKDAGFDASTAATSTRNILLNLANSSGALAKKLGGSVKSFDQLIPALVKLRNEGVDLNTTLKLTDKRSVAAFNTFLNGAESATELRDGLIDVNDELDQMVETKLDNLAGDVTKLSSAWQGFILTIENGEGVIANASRGIVQFITRAVQGLSNLDIAFTREANLSAAHWDRIIDPIGGFTTESGRLISEVIENFDKLTEGIQPDTFDKYIKLMQENFFAYFEAEGESIRATDKLWQAYLRRRKEQLEAEAQARLDALNALNEDSEETMGILERLNKKLKELQKQRKEAGTATRIALIDKEIHQTKELIKSYDIFARKIEEVKKQTKAFEEELKGFDADIDIDITEALSMNDFDKQLADLNNILDREQGVMSKWYDELGITRKASYQAELNELKFLYENKKINDKEYQKGRLALWMDYNREIIDAAIQLKDAIAGAAIELTNLQIQEAQQEYDLHDQQIEKLKDRLEKEQALKEAGSANNVDIVKTELNHEMAERNKAHKELANLRKREAKIEFAAQALSLITSTTNILASETKRKGAYGVIIAAAAIASMLAMFASYKSKINAINDEDVPGYAEGTEYLKRKNGEKKGKDTIFLRGDEGERIIPTHMNKELNGISNKELLNIYKMNSIPLHDPQDYKSNPYDIFTEGNQYMKELLDYHRNEEESFAGMTQDGKYLFKKAGQFIIREF